MKKIRVVQFTGYTLFIVYISLIILRAFNYFGDWSNIAFSLVLAIISIALIRKGVLLRSTSTLWFAISLILYAITIIILQLCTIRIDEFYYLFAYIPVISSLIILAIFHNLIYIKVIILNISVSIPITIRHFVLLEWWWVMIISIASIVFGILICRSINLDKEKIDG